MDDYKVSIMVPLYNEQESLPVLIRMLDTLMNVLVFAVEVVLVDYGSKDSTFAMIEEKPPLVLIILMRKKFQIVCIMEFLLQKKLF